MIEFATGICAEHAQALRQLREIRGALVESARRVGVGLSGGGTHPFQDWSHRQIHDTPRFTQLAQQYGYLAKQFTVFGQHVHIGCPGPDQALFLLNWDDFARYFEKMARTGVIQGMKDFYWDIRPKPEFGTVEARVLDTPLTIERAAALAAYIQCLARRLWVERPFVMHADDYLPYTFNRFQACRFGLDARFVDPGAGEQRTLHDDLLASLVELEPHAMALHAEEALVSLRGEVQGSGNDATWIRATQAASSHPAPLVDVVRKQVERWEGGTT